MVLLPPVYGAFQFITVACLRAHQLSAGCAPRVDGAHSVAVMAQMEVAAGKVQAVDQRTGTGSAA
jgi:DNA-directed RNA polymerase subunit K/omega